MQKHLSIDRPVWSTIDFPFVQPVDKNAKRFGLEAQFDAFGHLGGRE